MDGRADGVLLEPLDGWMACDNCRRASEIIHCTTCEDFFCDSCRGFSGEPLLCERYEPVVGAHTACLICSESVQDKPALRCSQRPCKPIHAACTTPGKDACPQCWAPLTGVLEIREICKQNRPSEYCKPCGGAAICEHDRVRGYCKDCGGSGICEHNRVREMCLDCQGHAIPLRQRS